MSKEFNYTESLHRFYEIGVHSVDAGFYKGSGGFSVTQYITTSNGDTITVNHSVSCDKGCKKTEKDCWEELEAKALKSWNYHNRITGEE